jgi:hypothetical protein
MKFEYVVESFEPDDARRIEEVLNEAGKDGWELVTGYIIGGLPLRLILKRELS